jgi:predicted nucleotidyltransferase component of viral defense system
MAFAENIKLFAARIKEKHKGISEQAIEKDFYLTLILNEISRDISRGCNSPFSKLIFKGGTLLSRSHLNYHRISEDLDFTYLENQKLSELSSKQRKKAITTFTQQLAERIYEIGKKLDLDFSTDKKDKKYCRVMDRKNVYIFRIYYIPVYGEEEFIKFEVNFNDELIYPPLFEDIKHLFDLGLIKDLEFTEGIKIQLQKNILCYNLKEIAGEKIRAVLTRPAIKERDLLDLFLISKIINLESLDKKKIADKIANSKSFIKRLPEKIKSNMDMLSEHRKDIIEEKSKLILIEINEKEYLNFEKKIMPSLIEVKEQALKLLGN